MINILIQAVEMIIPSYLNIPSHYLLFTPRLPPFPFKQGRVGEGRGGMCFDTSSQRLDRRVGRSSKFLFFGGVFFLSLFVLVLFNVFCILWDFFLFLFLSSNSFPRAFCSYTLHSAMALRCR